MKNTTKEKYEEIFDYLSYILCFFMPIVFYLPIYCIPPLLKLIGLSNIAFISFIILTFLSVLIITYSVYKFVVATKELDANIRNRCIAIWIVIGGCNIISFILSNLTGIF